MLEQFERNHEPGFLLTVYEQLDARDEARGRPLRHGIKLTLLTEVAQNGVHTLEMSRATRCASAR